MEFFGISVQKIQLPGWPRRVPVHFRWQQCTMCNEYRQETFSGVVVAQISKLTDKQIEHLFPTEERPNERTRKNRKAKPSGNRLPSGASA